MPRIAGRRPARPAARRRSTSATPARCCACCRAGSPGRPGGHWTLDGDDSIRRRPVDRVAVPLRQMGAELRCREERLPPLEIDRRAAARHRPTSCRSPAPRSSPACSSPACSPTARPAWSSRCRPATTPSACSPPPAPTCAARATTVVIAPGRAPRAGPHRRPRRLLLGRLLHRRRDCSSPAARSCSTRSASTRPAPACSRSSSGWAPRIEVEPRGEDGGEPIGDLRVGHSGAAGQPRSAAPRCRWRSTSCRWSPSPPASPRGRRRSATPPSCAARSPTGSRP